MILFSKCVFQFWWGLLQFWKFNWFNNVHYMYRWFMVLSPKINLQSNFMKEWCICSSVLSHMQFHVFPVINCGNLCYRMSHSYVLSPHHSMLRVMLWEDYCCVSNMLAFLNWRNDSCHIILNFSLTFNLENVCSKSWGCLRYRSGEVRILCFVFHLLQRWYWWGDTMACGLHQT